MRAKGEHLSWRGFWGIAGPSFRRTYFLYIVIFFLIIMASVAQVIEPIIYGKIIDLLIRGFKEGEIDVFRTDLMTLVVVWAGVFTVHVVCNVLGHFAAWRASYEVWVDFSKRFLRKILDYEVERFSTLPSGEMAKRFEKATGAIETLSSHFILNIIPPFFTFLFVLIAGFYLDWRMTAVALSIVPAAMYIGLLAYRRAEQPQTKLNLAWERSANEFMETIQNIWPVKAFVREQEVLSRETAAVGEVAKRQVELNRLWAMFDAINSMVRVFSKVLVLSVGLYFILQGSLTVGTLITFLGMLSYLYAPFDYILTDALRRYSEARTAFARIAEDWYTPSPIFDKPGARRLRNIKGELIFDNVSYQYKGKPKLAVRDINLKMPAGSTLALVGISGAGKSTLTRMINRFIDPTAGKITLDGVDLRDLRVSDLRHAVGIVSQDTVMFRDTVFNNVRFAKPSATRAEVIDACRRAQADEFIRKMPEGYETMVGERGSQLSGGERQRLALARVFLLNPSIIMLDEPTSALDSETEELIQAALRDLTRGRTSIIIAHRLSTILGADQIAVMREGKIEDIGKHAELIKKGGLYARLWKLQSGGFLQEELTPATPAKS